VTLEPEGHTNLGELLQDGLVERSMRVVLLGRTENAARIGHARDDGFRFTPQAGVGLCTRLGPRTSIDTGVRLHHAPKARPRERNGGLDSVQLRLGLAYHFE